MRNGILLFLPVVLLAGTLATAQSPPVSPEVRKEILAYQLNMPLADRLISVLPLMTRFFMAQPPKVLASWATQTPAGKITSLKRNSQVMAILKPYQLTARDYVVGVPALRLAVWRAEGVPEGPKVFTSSANLAFAKSHFAQLKPKWEAVDGPPHPN